MIENPLAVSGRRYQTSISLPPALWSDFDRTATDAGISTGELLTAVLRNGLPQSPESALDALERLLDHIPPDEGLLEERNYRLPLQLREALDRLAKILTPGPRGNRSLLVRAILVDHPLTTAEQARELANALRIQAIRESLHAAARGPREASSSS